MKERLIVAALVAACSHATAPSTDGGTADASASVLLPDAPALAADRSADAPDRKTVCDQACGLLAEPCADFPPPIISVCKAECALRTEEQVQCAWAALSAPVQDVSRLCDEVSRCLGFDKP